MKTVNAKSNNKIKYIKLPFQENISYFFSVQGKIESVIVLVHGISRNAKEIIDTFTSHTELKNTLLIAPLFTKEYAADYQRLGRNGKGPRADYQLMGVLNDIKSRLNIKFTKFNLFGFSAGAQYAHRFAFAHPNLVHKIALAAAGWYTYPTQNYSYPIGCRLKNQFNDIKFEPKRFLRLNYKVYIGSKDNLRDKSLNKNPKIDKFQGKDRISRANNWINFMHNEMEKYEVNNHIDFEILSGVGHDYLECVNRTQLVHNVLNWIQGKNND